MAQLNLLWLSIFQSYRKNLVDLLLNNSSRLRCTQLLNTLPQTELDLTAPQRPRPIPTLQPASSQSLAQQQRPILPYVFQPSNVPQTPVETTLAAPLITKGEATSGTAVYPSYSPVTTTTAEGLYTLTDAQVYWNSLGRPQCFKMGCDNNQSIGRSHILVTNRLSEDINGRDYPLL
ncbi:hypothetical protein KCU71_g98, partial [Aureobasidium melanogenum]